MTLLKQIFAFLLLYITLCHPLNNASAQGFERKIDSLIQTEFKDTNGPGGVFMITKNGKPVYQKAFGKSNLELDVALTPENVFQIGSMTKQFTAIAVLMLEEQGKLSVKDPVSKYIADYPSGDKITIHHLLTHTSGIKDFTKMKSLSEISKKEMTAKMLVDFFKNEPGYVNKTMISYSVAFSAGGLMSTAGDLLKWQNALNQNLLVRAETLKKAFRKYTLNNGEAFSYGYGWHIKDINGTPTREHGGNIFGFKSMGVYIPSGDIYVIGLSNCDCHSPTQVTKDMAALALENYKKK